MYYRRRRTELSYRKVPKATGCPFCQLDDPVLNPLPRRMVQQTDHMYVTNAMYPYDFWEYMPVTEHLMVFPVRHVTSMRDLTAAERKDFVDIICEYESTGYSVYSRAPSNVARSVGHIHTHLIKMTNQPPRIYLTMRKPYTIVRW